MPNSNNPRADNKWLFAFVLLPAAEAVISIILIFSTSSEGENARFLGLSIARWGLVFALITAFSGFACLSWLRVSHRSLWSRFEHRVSAFLIRPIYYRVCLVVFLFLVITSSLTILLTYKFTDVFVLARLQRTFPISLWIFLFSLQSLAILPNLTKDSSPRPRLAEIRSAWLPSLIAFGTVAIIASFVGILKIGLQPDKVGWDNLGVPLLETQIFISLILAAVFYRLFLLLEKKFGWRLPHIDLLIAIFLWIFAVWSWQSQPLTPTFFSPSPHPPNFEFYPYSDAATHDLGAQSLLIGNGFPDILEKPLYSLFLAGLHAVAGQGYQSVAFAQITVLALFPVVLYFLASRLHHRFSGAMLAVAVILREANSISLSGDIRVSHSKLLMTDLPAALAIAAFTLLLLRWLQTDARDHRWLIGVGGALGFLVLLRSQALILLPVLLLLAFLISKPKKLSRFLRAGLVFFGFALAFLPWLFRNYQVTGQFGYSQPLQAAYLAKQYSLTPESGDPQFPEGTEISDYVSLGFSNVLRFTLDHPVNVLGFVSAHFFHNEVSSLLALPIQFDFADKLVTFYNLRPYWIGLEGKLWTQCCSLSTYVNRNPYWQSWNGNFSSQAWLPIFVNLSLISIGIGAAWKKVKWLVLTPIGIHLFYSASSAIARVSGWRLILPVDWVLLLFYCLGISQLTFWVWAYLFGARSDKEKQTQSQKDTTLDKVNWSQLGLISVTIFLLGLLLPFAEVVIPSRYTPLPNEDVQSLLDELDVSKSSIFNVKEFLLQPGAEVLIGRALYPRFYAANEGEPGGEFSAFNALPFSRIALVLIGPQGNYQIALPLESASPSFPNASDVVILGCEENDYFRAAVVLFTDHSAPDLMTTTADPLNCSN